MRYFKDGELEDVVINAMNRVKLLTIPVVVKSLPKCKENEILEYCCLGFPNDWYKIPKEITDFNNFSPLKIRIKKPDGQTEIVYKSKM
jgi:hypothetical protein